MIKKKKKKEKRDYSQFNGYAQIIFVINVNV